ncbi:MAG: CoA-binding protein [archaeon]
MVQLTKVFYPKSIALIGASDKLDSVGRTLSENLSTYSGNIYLINPRLSGCKLFRRDIYKSILALPEVVDLCIIAVPTKVVIQVVLDVVKSKCKNIIMVTSGFNEVGKDKLTKELIDIIEKNNINLIGPNCLGLLNLDNNLNATFNSKNKLILPLKGNVSIISQSGALGIALLDLAGYEGLKVNKFISYGNALNIDESDLLEFLETDKETDVILAYIEGIKNGKKFMQTLSRVASKKKVIILKGGISNIGNQAAMSHTAAIAGTKEVFDTVISGSGAYQVRSITEMFNLAKILSTNKNKIIKNVQVITNGGGLGVLVSDQLDLNKIPLAIISKESTFKLKKMVPEYAVIRNPIDLTGDATTDRFIETIKVCLNDKAVDSIVLLFLFQLPSLTVDIIKKLEIVKATTSKPIFVVSVGGNLTKEFLVELEKIGIICFRDPKDFSENLKYLL